MVNSFEKGDNKITIEQLVTRTLIVETDFFKKIIGFSKKILNFFLKPIDLLAVRFAMSRFMDILKKIKSLRPVDILLD